MDTTQVQPDEDLLRRNLALTLGTQPPMIPHAQPSSPDIASPGPITMPGAGAPDLSISPPQSVKAPRGTVQGDQAKRTHDLTTGSGISQIAQKVEGSKLGQEHPLLGKILGGVGKGLATAGDIGLSAIAPALAINLPGTEYHHLADIHGLNKQIGAESKEQQAEATTGAENARTALEEKQTEQIPLTDQRQREAVNGQLAEHGLQLGDDGKIVPVSAENLSPELAAKLQGQWKPVAGAQGPKGEPLEYNETTGQYRPAPGVEGAQAGRDTKTIQREVNGKPHTILLDAQGNDIRDLGETGEKPPTVNVNAGQNEADKIGARLGKPYETAATAAQNKLDRIDQTSRSVDAGYVGQGLAIPELLTSLVSGQGTGVRITQPELNAITKHRGIQGDAESWFNSLAGKGNLTANDKAQIKSVLADAKVRVLEKIQLMNDAQDAINAATSREDVVNADKKYRAIQTAMEKFMEVRRDEQGNYYGSNDGGKTAFDLATGKEAK
jgi:hypothetical protein